jgi:hypothetical protein
LNTDQTPRRFISERKWLLTRFDRGACTVSVLVVSHCVRSTVLPAVGWYVPTLTDGESVRLADALAGKGVVPLAD